MKKVVLLLDTIVECFYYTKTSKQKVWMKSFDRTIRRVDVSKAVPLDIIVN